MALRECPLCWMREFTKRLIRSGIIQVCRWLWFWAADRVLALRQCFPFQFLGFSAVMKRALLSPPVLVRLWLLWDSAASILHRLGWSQ